MVDDVIAGTARRKRHDVAAPRMITIHMQAIHGSSACEEELIACLPRCPRIAHARVRRLIAPPRKGTVPLRRAWCPASSYLASYLIEQTVHEQSVSCTGFGSIPVVHFIVSFYCVTSYCTILTIIMR